MTNYKVGQLVRYINKNEIGLIGEVQEDGKLRVWWHTGGTRARIAPDQVEPIESVEASDAGIYSNGYALRSLLRRQTILLEYGISDPRLYDLIEV